MIRSLYRADRGPDRLVYLNVGGLTNMAVAEGTTCRFTRVLGGGLETMATDVADRRGIPLVQARQLLLDIGMRDRHATPEQPVAVLHEEASEEPTAALSLAGESDIGPQAADSAEVDTSPHESAPAHDENEDVHRVLDHGVRDIAGEVRNSLDFQQSQDGGEQVAAVVLSGLALEIPGFSAELERELGIQVQPGTVGSVDDTAIGLISPDRLAVAAGLATEEVSA
jgi:type IV pilus assembly protein PilM